MHAFGDPDPSDETADYMCSIVSMYLEKIIIESSDIGRLKGKFDEECILFCVRSNRKKFKRVKELLERKRAIDKELNFEI